MDFKALRAAKNKKAQSMIESSGGKVDSSTWTPDEMLNADAKTGMRPISRRAFKTGGKVEGEKAKTNLSRAPRGFQETVGLANTNQKDANEEREGVKHVGGFKRGGRAGYQTYGAVDGARLDTVGPDEGGEKTEPMEPFNGRKVSSKQEAGFNEAQKQQAAWEAEQRAKGDMTRRKDGGKAEASGYARGGSKMKKAAERDVGEMMAEEEMPSYKAKKIGRKAMKDMPTADIRKKMGDDRSMERGAFMPSMNDDPYKRGGKAEKFEGSAKDQMQDKKLAAKRGMSMKEWEASKADDKHDSQKSMKGLKTGGAAHDKDCMCKACGGSAGYKRGGGLYANIHAKRERGEKMRDAGDKGAPTAEDFKNAKRTARATGGRTKGTTNISINVMPHSPNKPMGIQPPMPPMPPVGGPPPMAPPPERMSLPPGLGAAMAGASGAGPMPPPSGAPMPPPMGRKSGGKVYPKMHFGSGGGKGRLEKIDEYGKNA